MKKRGLGRGLSELGVSELLASASLSSESASKSDLTKLPLESLRPGKYQPRRHMNPDALEELANSIRTQGIIQPLIVRKTQEGYEIIAGERRWRAARAAGLDTVPVVIKDINDETALAISLIENIQRQDLNVIEEAYALARLVEEFQMTHQEVATAVGKSRATVTNLLRLLKLDAGVRDLVEQGKLDMGHARALLTLDHDMQRRVANLAVEKALTVRQTEELIRKLTAPPAEPSQKAALESTEIDRLKGNLASRLNTKVSIKQSTTGRGKLIIFYEDVGQLDDILQHIN